VEDDPTARKAITLILKKLGFAVSEAGTVADGMRGLGQQPDWVLLDLMLPDGNGMDVLRKVKANRRSSKVCIITGCDSEMLKRAEHAGAEHTFVKPLDPSHLIAVLTGPSC
jgi:DNA-binding response OmpR family regulator